jgi:hypothetical protein
MDVRQRITARKTLKLFNAANTDNFLTIITDPDRDRISPIAVP